jgi:hypothetical protein
MDNAIPLYPLCAYNGMSGVTFTLLILFYRVNNSCWTTRHGTNINDGLLDFHTVQRDAETSS